MGEKTSRLMKRLIYTRLITVLIIGISCGMGTEATTASEAKYIIKNFPGFLSIVFFASSVFGMCQFLLSKIRTKVAMWVPVVFDLIMVPLIFVLFFYQEYFYMLTITVLTEALSGIFYMNRNNTIVDRFKNITSIKNFFNLKASIFAGGQLLGYALSYIMIHYLDIDFIIVYLISIISWSPTLLILIYENIIITRNKDENKSSTQ
jgi:hypothetical protein